MRKTLAGLAGVVPLAAGAAPAHARSVSLSIPLSVSVGQAIPYGFTASGLRGKDRLVLQRQQGTGRVWRTVIRLPHARRGQGTLKGFSALGPYPFRVAMLNSHGQVIATRRKDVRVFGQVPLSVVADLEPQSKTTPTRTFTYVLYGLAETEAKSLLRAERNYCRSVHLDFLVRDESRTPPKGIVTVVQESTDPVSASADNDTVGTLDANLVPGQTWSINITQERNSALFTGVYVNGYASCYRAVALGQGQG